MTTVTKRPRVLILGLLPGQAHMLRDEFKDTLDLRFVKIETPGKEVKRKMADCDHILSVKWVNHDMLLPLRGLAHYQHIRGGLTTLRHALEALS